MRAWNIEGFCILAVSDNQCRVKAAVMITRRRKVTFPDSRRNWSSAASFRRSKKPARRSSATSKGINNRIRLHSGLGYKSPLEFEKQLDLKTKQRSRGSFVCGKT
jgi:hypothetical protein